MQHWRARDIGGENLQLFSNFLQSISLILTLCKALRFPRDIFFCLNVSHYSNWVISGPTTLLSSAAVVHLKKVNLVWGHMAALQVAQRQISAESPALFVDICSDWRNETKMHREALGNWSCYMFIKKIAHQTAELWKNKVMATIIIFLSYFAMKTFTKKESQ